MDLILTSGVVGVLGGLCGGWGLWHVLLLVSFCVVKVANLRCANNFADVCTSVHGCVLFGLCFALLWWRIVSLCCCCCCSPPVVLISPFIHPCICLSSLSLKFWSIRIQRLQLKSNLQSTHGTINTTSSSMAILIASASKSHVGELETEIYSGSRCYVSEWQSSGDTTCQCGTISLALCISEFRL